MAYRQDGPVPEHVKLTLRVDSASYPELAAMLWEMPWGARNAALIDLLVLGMLAKAAGADSSIPTPSKQLSPKRFPPPHHIASSRAVSTSVLDASNTYDQAVTPGSSPLPLPNSEEFVPQREELDDPVEEPSAVSLLLGQFVG